MTPRSVRLQLREIYARLLSTNMSVKQNYPKERNLSGGGLSIGNLPPGSISLRDSTYEQIYTEIDKNEVYHVKFPDGGLLVFQYLFDGNGNLDKHRLCFFPSHVLPAADEAPDLYENDELYGDIILEKLVRFPVRFDYDPKAKIDVKHPASHLTLGQFENCRIPVDGPVSPNSFLMFLLRNFYSNFYVKHKNVFDKRLHYIQKLKSISETEQRISHFVTGR